MMLIDEIIFNWSIDIPEYAQKISSLSQTEYPAWTVKYYDCYGVVMSYDGSEEINEAFTSVKIQSKEVLFEDGIVRKALVLTCDNHETEAAFAELCFSLINPGKNGEHREKVLKSPLEWWKNWKEMLGNRNIDERIYDVLGELCVLKQLLETSEDIVWNGPNRSSYDIETTTKYVEVKSTTVRDKKEVQISSQFQLDPEEKPLWLILCQFEPMILSGVSIDSIVEELRLMGYNINEVNRKLHKRGFEIGMSSRRRPFKLHNMLRYIVDDSFPKITPASFVGGDLPTGITKITYTVDLSGLQAASMVQGEANGEV